MLSFALAAGKSIPLGVRAALMEPEPADLPFLPKRHTVWTNPSQSVLFAGWDDDVSVGMGDRCWVDPGGLTAFTGTVWPRKGSFAAEQWAPSLRRHLCTGGVEDLLGIFTLVNLDAAGRGAVMTDALGTSLVYRAKVGDTTILSSRAPIAARVAADGTPRRDPLGVGWLAYSRYPIGQRTGFEGVDVVRPDERIEVGPDGVRFRLEPAYWRQAVEGDPRDLIDEVYADVVASLEAALAFPVERRVAELTGGKDSRLVLAFLLAEGLADQFEFRTYGSPSLPDVVVADEYCQRFGLRHRINQDDARRRHTEDRLQRLAALLPDAPARERRLRANVADWSGMRNCFQVEALVPPTGDRVTLNGTYGEALSSNHLKTNRIRHHAGLQRTLLVGWKFGQAGILTSDALAYYREQLMAIVYEGSTLEDPPHDVIDDMYLRQKARRWFGITQEADESNHLLPLQSPLGVRLGFSLGPRVRREQWIYRELYRRTRPELADEPFTSRPWPDTVVPDRRPEPAEPPDLTTPTLPATGAQPPSLSNATAESQERQRTQRKDVRIMQRFLLDDGANPVHDILDRAALESTISRFESLPDTARKQLFGALTAAIWLGGHEAALAPT